MTANGNNYRIHFSANDITEYFEKLSPTEIPTFETLLVIAKSLVKRYASQRGHERALSKSESTDGDIEMSIKLGTPWASPSQADQSDTEELGETMLPQDDDCTSEAESGANEGMEGKVHVEKPGFDGDRVLANEQLFLQDHGWWIEAAYAVPEGDVGRVYEILKVCYEKPKT